MPDDETNTQVQMPAAAPLATSPARPTQSDLLASTVLAERQDEAAVRAHIRNAFTTAMTLIGGRPPGDAKMADALLEESVWQFIRDHFQKSASDYSGGKKQVG